MRNFLSGIDSLTCLFVTMSKVFCSHFTSPARLQVVLCLLRQRHPQKCRAVHAMLIFTVLKHFIKGRAKVSLWTCSASPSQYCWTVMFGTKYWGHCDSFFFWMSHAVIVIYSKSIVTSTQAPSQTLKANMHPVAPFLCTSEGWRVKC